MAASRVSAFTLVEVLIAVMVLSGILGASYLCLHAGLESRRSVEAHADSIQKARVALELMTADLRGACALSDEFEFVGADRELAGVEADNVDFGSHNWNPQVAGEGDFCEMSYYVDRSRTAEGLSLFRRRDPTPDMIPLDGGIREEIVAGLAGLKLEYYDGYSWCDTWGRQTERTQEETERSLLETNLYGLPDAVRITIGLAAPEGSAGGSFGREGSGGKLLIKFQTVVFLPLAERARTASYGTAGVDGAAGESAENEESAGGEREEPGGER